VTFGLALPLSACSGANEHMGSKQTVEHMDDGHSHTETTAPIEANMSHEAKNVEAVMSNYSKQITAKDLAAMEAYVLTDGEEFTIFEGKGTNIGWADYRDNHLAPELANEDLVFTKYDFIDFKTFVDGNIAAVTFSIDAAYNYKGKEASHVGHGTAILKKVDGKWKIAHMQT
ncbi:MAG TPA: nuclear transport factor 2 family protein, partial [Gammaproteobacteria bacterium]|nr:nuclear transport factor 2 family protein [Gammaproteobacteria bacterium]